MNSTDGTIHRFRSHYNYSNRRIWKSLYSATLPIHTGDGNAMVLRAGLPLQDMGCPVSSNWNLWCRMFNNRRGQRKGGFLVNGKGERFMKICP